MVGKFTCLPIDFWNTPLGRGLSKNSVMAEQGGVNGESLQTQEPWINFKDMGVGDMS